MSTQDEQWMQIALELAEKGLYTAHPNPRVGCVIVQGSEIVGRGWHQITGQAHAEPQALAEAGSRARGATCYVTLAPCAHQGRTPPCSEALQKAGIARLVVASEDPNPEAVGGLEALKAEGMAVTLGVCEQQARALNLGFFSRILRARPFVRAKVGMSADARTAMASGQSQWITGKAAREDVQHWRAQSGAIVTGIGTILADDPQLTVRKYDIQQPWRVVLDTQGRLPATAALWNSAGKVMQIIGKEAQGQGQAKASQICRVPQQKGRLDLVACMALLAEHQVNDVLIEAGSTLLSAALEAQIVDELILYVAPKLLGHEARPLAYLPYKHLAEHLCLTWKSATPVGEDIRLIASVEDKER